MNHPETPDEDPTFDWNTPEDHATDERAAQSLGEMSKKAAAYDVIATRLHLGTSVANIDRAIVQMCCAADVRDEAQKTRDVVMAERDILWSAVAHVALRIMEDPDIGYHCGSLTDTFRKVAEAIAAHGGEDVEFVKLQMLKAKKQTEENYTPRVVQLQERIAELEENRRLSDEGNDPEHPIVGAHGAT